MFYASNESQRHHPNTSAVGSRISDRFINQFEPMAIKPYAVTNGAVFA